MGLCAVITSKNTTDAIDGDAGTSDTPADNNGSLIFFITAASIGSYAIYFSIGGFLHVSIRQFHLGRAVNVIFELISVVLLCEATG